MQIYNTCMRTCMHVHTHVCVYMCVCIASSLVGHFGHQLIYEVVYFLSVS